MAHGGLRPPGPEPVRLLGCCGHHGIIARIGGGTARTPCLMRHRCNMRPESLCISKDLLWILIPPFPGSNPGAPASTQGAELFTETALLLAEFLRIWKSIPPCHFEILCC